MIAESELMTCHKCKGSGAFIGYTGRVVDDCFTCGGTGKITLKEPAPQVLSSPHYFPKTLELMRSKGIRLYLGDCKIVMTLTGKFCLVSMTYGYYGTFGGDGQFRPTKECTEKMIATLRDVEARGIEAVKDIGRLTGVCCVCGRTLTNEESIADGIGPVCAGKW